MGDGRRPWGSGMWSAGLLLLLSLQSAAPSSQAEARLEAEDAHFDELQQEDALPDFPDEVDALVVGGGPAGLAAAIVLAESGAQVAMVERRHSADAFELERSYLYLIDGRGQRFLHAYGLAEEVKAAGVRHVDTIHAQIWPDAKRGATCSPPARHALNSNDSFIERAGVYVPCTTFLRILDARAKAAGVHLAYGTSFDALAFSRDAPGAARVTAGLRAEDGAESSISAKLVLGCDGMRSKVREELRRAHASSRGTVPVVPRNGTRMPQRSLARSAAHFFSPVELPSASSGLLRKMLPLPGRFAAVNLRTKATFRTDAEAAYFIPSVTGPMDTSLRFELQPSSDAKLPRMASVVCRPDHHIWTIGDAEELVAYLRGAFPQLRMDGLVSLETADAFIQSPATVFPAPQFVRGLALYVQTMEDATGAALLGDSAHAFPPDIQQGVNAALEDVMGLRSALLNAAPEDSEAPGALVLTTPLRLKQMLGAYQAARAPEAEAVARIARVGFPFQYQQSRLREQFFLAGFVLRKVFAVLAGELGVPDAITEPAVLDASAGRRSYSDVWRRAQRTTMVALTTALGLVAGVVLRARLQGDEEDRGSGWLFRRPARPAPITLPLLPGVSV